MPDWVGTTKPYIRCGFERKVGGTGGRRTGLCSTCRAVLTKAELKLWTTPEPTTAGAAR